MKVLHIVGGLDFGGIEKWLSNIFKKSGNKFDNYVLSLHPTKNSIVPFLNLPLDRIFFTAKNNVLSRIIRLVQVVTEEKPDVIHCHAGYSSGIYAFIAKILQVKTVVIHSHSDRRVIDANVSFIKKCYISAMKYLLSNLHVERISVSKESGKSLYNSNFNVMHCGVLVNKNDLLIDCLEDLIEDEKTIIFHIGRYTEAKNFPFLFNILEKFKSNSDFHFVFISGELDAFAKQCKNKGIDNATFLGQVEDPSSIMCKYGDLFILPSRWEGLPLSAVEAQLSGLKCILSTNITEEVDLGLVTYCDLNIDDWYCEIINRKSNNNQLNIESARKFSIESNIDELLQVYSRKV